MIEIVINAPHLQTRRQRLSAVLLNLSGWLLWCYFAFPLLSLGCWFLHYPQCAQWVSLSGGYRDFPAVASWYIGALATIICLWQAWVIYRRFKHQRRPAVAPPAPVSTADLCQRFNVTAAELNACVHSRVAIVHYDAHGHIISLECQQGSVSKPPPITGQP